MFYCLSNATSFLGHLVYWSLLFLYGAEEIVGHRLWMASLWPPSADGSTELPQLHMIRTYLSTRTCFRLVGGHVIILYISLPLAPCDIGPLTSLVWPMSFAPEHCGGMSFVDVNSLPRQNVQSTVLRKVLLLMHLHLVSLVRRSFRKFIARYSLHTVSV